MSRKMQTLIASLLIAGLAVFAGCDETAVTVPEPVPAQAEFTGRPLSGVAPLVVGFTNLSAGDFDKAVWNFGDGCESTHQAPAHIFTKPGTFTVELTLYRGDVIVDTESKPAYVFADNPALFPAADFEFIPTTGIEGQDVQFLDKSTGEVDSWSWDFGDGSSSVLTNPVHVYAAAGTYAVSLTVSGPRGTDAISRNVVIAAIPPVCADFALYPASGSAPLEVFFTDRSTGQVNSWHWDFGDGASSDLQHPSHVYNGLAGATFTVTLTVTAPYGSDSLTRKDCVMITLTGPPMPCVPVIYLYPEAPRVEDVKVIFEGFATVTIPEVELGREIEWKDCFADGVKIRYGGKEYDYLFYECELDKPVESHRGWVLSRDEAGCLRLNGRETDMDGLRAHFESELAKAGLYSHEIRDFTGCWLGADEALFFGRRVFTYAVKYFPIDQVERTMRIVTSWKYDSRVRVQFYVEPCAPGLELLAPVYPAAAAGRSVMHEWGVTPVKDLLAPEGLTRTQVSPK